MLAYEELSKLHPCLSDVSGETGRIHLPVSPACNLCCGYCSRVYTDLDQRPGLSRGILPVKETLPVLEKALALCPGITTVGIAGPGDTLASPHALQAFRVLDRAHPKLIKCMSTNGLMLPRLAEEIAGVHVDTLTVTVNAVDPGVQVKITDRIFYDGHWIIGEEAADRLIKNQLAGIKKAASLGIAVKINTVLIPGINEGQIEEIARKTAQAGARIYNIIPLIPQAEMASRPAPDCRQIDRARVAAKAHLKVFGHCQHCRADAVGLLGERDFGREVYGGLMAEAHFSHG